MAHHFPVLGYVPVDRHLHSIRIVVGVVTKSLKHLGWTVIMMMVMVNSTHTFCYAVRSTNSQGPVAQYPLCADLTLELEYLI